MPLPLGASIVTEYTAPPIDERVKEPFGDPTALLVDTSVQFAEIEKVAYDTERRLLKDVYLFDVYEGKNLESGKRSYAVSFILQDETKTLNDKQIESIMNRIIANLQQKLNAKLR